MKVGTARMAHLSLPNSVLRVGVDFSGDAVVRAELGDLAQAYVLFPKPGARDIRELRDVPAVKLVVLDGTWREARKLLKRNPFLQRLPAVAFTPTQPSDYRIRKQPAAHCLSTIEALAEALSLIEPEGLACDPLLAPFRAMVERQLWFITEVHRGRCRLLRKPVIRNPPFARLCQDYPRILCVQGEANAWALKDPHYCEPSIVYWVAHRPASGETYEALIKPTGAIAPMTPRHSGLSENQLLAGVTREAWQRSWQDFFRPDDLVLQWGYFYSGVAQREGLALPGVPLDLRVFSAQALRRRCGTMDDLLRRVGDGCEVVDLGLQGRAGQRLSALVALVKALSSDGGSG